MSPKTFNVGVVGYGLSAKVFHIPLVQHVDGLRLHAVLQRTPKPRSDDVREDHPDVKHYSELPSLLADPDLDVVVVTSTPDSHYSIASAALAAGKHVIVEKPFAPTSKECRDLDEQAKKAGKRLIVYQNRRWDLDFLTLKSLLAAGKLGRVVEFETHFDRHRPEAPTNTWKASASMPGNGVIYDLGSHLMDQVVSLFGLPQRITGFVYSQRDHNNGEPTAGAEDSCTVLLHYDNNNDDNKPGSGSGNSMIVTVKAGVVSPQTQQLRFWVRGTKGSFIKYGLDTQEDSLREGATPATPGFGTEPESQWGTLATAESKTVQTPVEPETYAAFYRGVLAALQDKTVNTNTHAQATASEAASVIRLIELARQSSAEGRTLTV